MSPVKEPNYFNHLTELHKNKKKIIDKKKYLSLFKKVKDEIIVGEASISYLESPDAPTQIRQQVPDARILISLRDPIERAFSSYLNNKRYRKVKVSFHDQLNKELRDEENLNETSIGLKAGLYFENVKRYLDTFSAKQVKIIIFEEWVKNLKTTLEDILEFLDLNHNLKNFEEEQHNPYIEPRGLMAEKILQSKIAFNLSQTMMPEKSRVFLKKFLFKKQPKPEITQEDRKNLIDFYRNDVKKVQSLLKRDLPWPNFQN